MIWDTRQTFFVLLLLMSVSFEPLSAQTPPSKERVPKVTASHREWTAGKRELLASYWTLEPGWSTELELRNNVPWRDLRMTPVLHTAGGEEVVLAPVDLKPEEIASLSLRDAVASVRPDLVDKTGAFGSVVFRFDGTAVGNGFAAAVVRREGHPIDFHFDADGIGSTSAEGIWWLAAESATDYLILSNPTGNKQTAGLTISEASGAVHRFPISMGPWQSVRINIREVLPAAQKGAFGGLSLSVSDKAGLFAAEIVYDEVSGLSTMLKLFDRQSLAEIDTVDSRTLRAPMMALSQPDASLGFPNGTILDPKIFLRNAGAATTAVSPNINWRSESKSGTSVLPQVTLPPGRVAVLRLADFQQAGQIPEDATWGTVNLGYTGRTGDLVAVAMSYDKTSRYGSQTPFIEGTNRLFKGSMWHVDSTHNTLITTGNGGTEPTRAQVTLFYNGGQGQYRVEQSLAPGGQIWLNLADLIRNQVPDSDGKTIPPDVMAGSYELRDLDHAVLGLLYEGKLVVDKTYGHASYGCAHCCGYSRAQLWQNPFAGPPNIDNPDTYQAYGVCESQWFDMDVFFNPHSSNTAVATLTGQTLHTVAVGSATASGKNTLPFQAPNGGLCSPAPMTGTQPVKVAQVQITSADLENNQINVTLSGPSGTSGTLEVIAIGVNNQPQITYNGGAAIGPGSYNVALNRPYMPADTYSSVKAIWNYDPIPAVATFNLTRSWLVLGLIRHSQYNTPYESSCSGSPQTAWVFNSSCTFTQVSLKSDFVSQTYINGTGASQSHGTLKYSTSCTNYPQGANSQNSFLTVSSITGACNATMSGGISVATYPSPNVGNPYGCGDNILLVTTSNSNQALKDVADYCPACSGWFNGTNGHIDDYSSSQSCSGSGVGDLGNYWTADTH